MKANLAQKPAGGDREQARDIHSGKCDIALGNTYYMALMATNEKNPEQKEWGNAIKPLFPNANDRGSHVNISGMALAKHAPNKANAMKLMEFLASDDAQKIYATANNEYPVNPKVRRSAIVQSWGVAQGRSAAARQHRQVSQAGIRAGRQGQLRRRSEFVGRRRDRSLDLQSLSPNWPMFRPVRLGANRRKVIRADQPAGVAAPAMPPFAAPLAAAGDGAGASSFDATASPCGVSGPASSAATCSAAGAERAAGGLSSA